MVTLEPLRTGFALCLFLGILAGTLAGAAGCVRHVVAEPGEVASRNSRAWNIRRRNAAGARVSRTPGGAPKALPLQRPRSGASSAPAVEP